jgi:hypothetical protein
VFFFFFFFFGHVGNEFMIKENLIVMRFTGKSNYNQN